jgi:hypothetical protein
MGKLICCNSNQLIIISIRKKQMHVQDKIYINKRIWKEKIALGISKAMGRNLL